MIKSLLSDDLLGKHGVHGLVVESWVLLHDIIVVIGWRGLLLDSLGNLTDDLLSRLATT